MNITEIKGIIKEIEQHEKKVAKVRDDLEEFIGTLSQLRDDSEESLMYLNDAKYALSRLV